MLAKCSVNCVKKNTGYTLGLLMFLRAQDGGGEAEGSNNFRQSLEGTCFSWKDPAVISSPGIARDTRQEQAVVIVI